MPGDVVTRIRPPLAAPVYALLSFFDLTALLLIVVTFPSWRSELSKAAQGYYLICVVLSASLGYAAFDRFGPWVWGFRSGIHPWTGSSPLDPFISIWISFPISFTRITGRAG